MAVGAGRPDHDSAVEEDFIASGRPKLVVVVEIEQDEAGIAPRVVEVGGVVGAMKTILFVLGQLGFKKENFPGP